MRVAVVGTGSIGRRHLGNLLALGYEPLAVSEHSRRPSVDLDGVDVPAVPSLEEALGSGVGAVFVGNPTSHHVDTATKVIAAGVDLYLEKPAAPDGADCARLAARAADAGVVVAVGQQLRFHPAVERARDLVRAGGLGTVLAVEGHLGEHLADYHPDEDYRTGYAARRELGGGVLLTQVHLLDLLTWLFGPFTSVVALGGHRTDLEIDVEDTVSFLARSVDDVPVYGHLDYLQRPRRWTLAATGTDGRVEVDLVAGTCAFTPAAAGADPEVTTPAVERNDLFLAAARDFFDAAARRGSPRCDLAQATAVLDLVDAVRRSMADGTVAPVVGTPAAERARG